MLFDFFVIVITLDKFQVLFDNTADLAIRFVVVNCHCDRLSKLVLN